MQTARMEQIENISGQRPEPQRFIDRNGNPENAFPSAKTLNDLAGAVVTGYVVEVTPAMARQWLQANTQNRKVRRNHVELLTRDIAEDRWRITHQGIAFSDKGRLIDGQHRLTAIIRADKPAFLTVFIGLSDEMFGALDRGQRRSVADELQEDRRCVDPCTWLVSRLRAPSGYRSPPPAEVQRVLAVYKPVLSTMVAAAPTTVRLRGNAGVRAAIMVRLRMANDADQKLLLGQWEAFSKLQVETMDKTTGALLRRMEGFPARSQQRQTSAESAAATWVAFDPATRALERIAVRDMNVSIAELCAAAAKHIGSFGPSVA